MRTTDGILRNPNGDVFRADRDYKAGELIAIPLEFLHEYFCIGHEWLRKDAFRVSSIAVYRD